MHCGLFEQLLGPVVGELSTGKVDASGLETGEVPIGTFGTGAGTGAVEGTGTGAIGEPSELRSNRYCTLSEAGQVKTKS